MIVLANEGEFENAIQSDRPVLVEFYKGGCPTCAALEPKLNKLAGEYQDCVTFARFELMKPYFIVTAPAIQDKYGIYFYPTVIVFVQGVEFQRWVMDQKVEDYRRGLDDVLGGAMPTTTPATTISATRPSTTAASRPPSVPATTRPSTTVAPVPAGTTAPTTAAARPSSPSSSQTSDGSR
jgi:thiol-disulfide isomerase/thioredoxin